MSNRMKRIIETEIAGSVVGKRLKFETIITENKETIFENCLERINFDLNATGYVFEPHKVSTLLIFSV